MIFNEMAEFAKLMTGLGMLYGKPMNECLIDIYWHALYSFDFKSIQEALQAHVKNPDTGQYLPKPADIVRYLEGGNHTKALHGWSLVTHAMRTVGRYESVVFDDPIIHIVITEMGGWLRLCEITEKDLPYRAHEFEKRYLGHAIHPPDTYPQKLIGLIESYNTSQGYPPQPPLLIGNFQQAYHIYEQGIESPVMENAVLRLGKLSTHYLSPILAKKSEITLKKKVDHPL